MYLTSFSTDVHNFWLPDYGSVSSRVKWAGNRITLYSSKCYYLVPITLSTINQYKNQYVPVLTSKLLWWKLQHSVHQQSHVFLTTICVYLIVICFGSTTIFPHKDTKHKESKTNTHDSNNLSWWVTYVYVLGIFLHLVSNHLSLHW